MADTAKKHRSYTISQKLDAVKRLKELSGNLSAASRDLGIDRKRLREWSKTESEMTNIPDKKRRRTIGAGRGASHPDVESQLFVWVKEQRANKLIVNYRRLREKAKEISHMLNISTDDFKCSDKWISNFMRRNGLSLRKITHVGQADNKTEIEKRKIAVDYLDSLPAVTTDLDAHQIFNMDETPVYVDMISSTTIDFVGNKNVDAAHCGATKARFTVVLCASAAGDILQSMIILKGLKKVPNVRVPKGIYLTVADKGSMTHALMHQWIVNVFGKRPGTLFTQKPSVLFMDECTAHKKDELMEALKKRKTVVKLIPPKTTSYLQPLDVSVNAPFKAALRHEWEQWFCDGEKEFTKKGYRKKPSYQQILDFVAAALASLKKDSISRAFECCGIAPRGVKVNHDKLNSRLCDVLYGDLPDIDEETLATADDIRAEIFDSDHEIDFEGF